MTTEHDIRITLAACHRLIAQFGWDDLIFTHLSARIPGRDSEYLITPYGWLFSDVTATSLIKVDIDAICKDPGVNISGLSIHNQIYKHRHNVSAIMHTHTDHGVSVSAQAAGLLPISQQSLLIIPSLVYHKYTGVSLNEEEAALIALSLSDSNFMILQNHGLMTVGNSIQMAFLNMYFLEKACKIQILAQSSHSMTLVPLPTSNVDMLRLFTRNGILGKMWCSLVDKLDPGYRT